MMRKWPVTTAEREAAWDYVQSLRERCGDDAAAAAEAVGVLGKSGVAVSVEELLACRPKRKGADTHVDDIGKALLAGGLENTMVDGRVEVEGIRITEVDGVRADDGDRMDFAADVLQAFFQKLLPEMPAGRVRSVGEKWVWIPRGGKYEVASCAKGDGRDANAAGGDGLMVGLGDVAGVLVVRYNGLEVPTLRGAVRVCDASGEVVRTLLNVTVKAVKFVKARGSYRLQLIEWGTGKADWDFVTKQLITYASMFAPDVVGRVTGATLGRLLGLTRAAVSMRRKKVAAEYKELTGGQASFPGMRARPDPRLGKKLGKRVKVGDYGNGANRTNGVNGSND